MIRELLQSLPDEGPLLANVFDRQKPAGGWGQAYSRRPQRILMR